MGSNTNAGIPREKIPWFPTIDPKKCTNCGACKEFCPNGVYADGDEAMKVLLPYKCVVGCSYCTTICPPQAIRFPSEDELMTILGELRKKCPSGKQANKD